LYPHTLDWGNWSHTQPWELELKGTCEKGTSETALTAWVDAKTSSSGLDSSGSTSRRTSRCLGWWGDRLRYDNISIIITMIIVIVELVGRLLLLLPHCSRALFVATTARHVDNRTNTDPGDWFPENDNTLAPLMKNVTQWGLKACLSLVSTRHLGLIENLSRAALVRDKRKREDKTTTTNTVA
jgi:hypothetical protein